MIADSSALGIIGGGVARFFFAERSELRKLKRQGYTIGNISSTGQALSRNKRNWPGLSISYSVKHWPSSKISYLLLSFLLLRGHRVGQCQTHSGVSSFNHQNPALLFRPFQIRAGDKWKHIDFS